MSRARPRGDTPRACDGYRRFNIARRTAACTGQGGSPCACGASVPAATWSAGGGSGLTTHSPPPDELLGGPSAPVFAFVRRRGGHPELVHPLWCIVVGVVVGGGAVAAAEGMSKALLLAQQGLSTPHSARQRHAWPAAQTPPPCWCRVSALAGRRSRAVTARLLRLRSWRPLPPLAFAAGGPPHTSRKTPGGCGALASRRTRAGLLVTCRPRGCPEQARRRAPGAPGELVPAAGVAHAPVFPSAHALGHRPRRAAHRGCCAARHLGALHGGRRHAAPSFAVAARGAGWH